MGLTAYPQTEEDFRRRMANAPVDRHGFAQRLRRCDLNVCHGTCCHDGVYTGAEEVEVLENLVRAEPEFFAERGITAQGGLFEATGDTPPWKTQTRPFPHSRETPGYPDHFPDTRCVFLQDDFCCSLQVLAAQRGQHPWYWKPLTCWLHPVCFHEDQRGRRITVYTYENDPQRTAGYDGFASRTPCGAAVETGEPASRILAPELDFLGQIFRRDLVSEAAARAPGT